MHIPNGFLTDPVCTVSTLAATAALGTAFAKVRQLDSSRSGALMAATAGGIFAAQMINFPIDHGTSGHVLGAAVAAILLGPWLGMLTMAVVLVAQCFFAGDGGVSTLGANILNMAVAGVLVASLLYEFISHRVAGAKGRLLGAGVAAFGSVMTAAALCSVELAASGTYGLLAVSREMLGVHALIGLGETVCTVAIVAALAAQSESAFRNLSARRVMIGGLAVAIAVAGLIAPWASSSPDGLERVAENLTFSNLAADNVWAAMPDYEMPGIAWPALAVALAGMAGVAVAFASAYAVGRTATVKVRKH